MAEAAAARRWADTTGAVPLLYEVADLGLAAARLRRPKIVDRLGVCPDLLVAAVETSPDVVSECIANTLASGESCRAVCVMAHAFGKKTSRPAPDGARLFMRLPTLWSMADVLFPARLHERLDSHAAAPTGCMEAGITGTGASHVALGSRLVIEKGMDSGSSGALAQGDIKQYFDHIDPMLCGDWLLSRGCRPSLVGAAVRHQLMPQVDVLIAAARAEVGDKSRVSVTGSRVAGALGRVAIRDVMMHVHATSAHRAFGPPEARILICSYIDNILVAGSDSSSASAILQQVEERLRTPWALSLPESSVEGMAPRGASVHAGDPAPLQHMKCLGHYISADGSVSACWAKAQGAVRSALWRHVRSARQARLPVAARLRIVDQFVWPITA